jgi:hypothetical protein
MAAMIMPMVISIIDALYAPPGPGAGGMAPAVKHTSVPLAIATCLSIDGLSLPPTETINFSFGMPPRSAAS